jgi:hypothetical protein
MLHKLEHLVPSIPKSEHTMNYYRMITKIVGLGDRNEQIPCTLRLTGETALPWNRLESFEFPDTVCPQRKSWIFCNWGTSLSMSREDEDSLPAFCGSPTHLELCCREMETPKRHLRMLSKVRNLRVLSIRHTKGRSNRILADLLDNESPNVLGSIEVVSVDLGLSMVGFKVLNRCPKLIELETVLRSPSTSDEVEAQ